MNSLRFILLSAVLALSSGISWAGLPASQKTIEFNVSQQPLGDALNQFAEQSGLRIVFYAQAARGRVSPPMTGIYTPEVALKILLSGSALQYRFVDDNTVEIHGSDSSASDSITPAQVQVALAMQQVESQPAVNLAGGETSDPKAKPKTAEDENTKGIPEVLVKGSRALNVDMQRSVDDPQPYVILDRETIQRSGALNINDFLKTRLTANATPAMSSQNIGFLGNSSNINLRGLGTSQTLILVDGRRMASISNGGTPSQPDLNGIPISAIERIEVLPTTASGIYGGGATGGVINVVLRRDYSGMEVNLSHQNTFDSDTTAHGLDFSAGFALEGGRTNVMLAGSYSDENTLTNADRDFVLRGRRAIAANNPDYFPSLTQIMPLGATPNIRSANGTNLVLKSGAALNSFFTSVPAGYAGPATDGGTALVANAGRYNLDLADTHQLASSSAAGIGGKQQSLMSSPILESATMTIRREFTSSIQAFLELSGANNNTITPTNVSLQLPANLPASAPNNPFTTAILVQVPDDSASSAIETSLRNRRFVGGVIARLPRGWTGEIDYALSRAQQYFFSPPDESVAGKAAMSDGTLNVMRDLRVYPLNLEATPGILTPYQQVTIVPFLTTSKNGTLRFSGPLGKLPAGALAWSSLLEYREDELREGKTAIGGNNSIATFPSKSQSVASAYVETLVPLVRGLELQVAGRYDRYVTHGATGAISSLTLAPVVRTTNRNNSVNPTFALRYQPLQDLTLRASYGTGFLPPDVTQLVSGVAPTTASNQGNDPLRGNAVVIAIATTGGNTNLRPEESETLSGGMIFTPRFVPGLRLSLDYTRLEKVDNIIALQAQQLIDNESILPGRVTRGARLSTDPVGWAGPILSIDRRLTNIASAKLEALDFQLSYRHSIGRLGSLDWYGNATRTLHYETQIAPTTPVLENVGYGGSSTSIANPSSFKANVGVSWEFSQWTVGWNTSYFNSYNNYLASDSAVTRQQRIANQGNGTGIIPSQAYHDVFATYKFGPDVLVGSRIGNVVKRIELQAGIKNVFNKEPPFDAGNTASYYSYYGDPRLATYYAKFTAGF